MILTLQIVGGRKSKAEERPTPKKQRQVEDKAESEDSSEMEDTRSNTGAKQKGKKHVQIKYIANEINKVFQMHTKIRIKLFLFSAKGFKIPKRNQLLEPDSEDEDLGQERVYTHANKFDSVNTSVMKKYIKADDMLPREMTQLCSKFQNLVLHSSTAQTWGRHRTAINAYTEFCTVYNTKVAWPASTEQIRAFSTWAVTYKKLQVSTVKTYISSISTIQHLGNVKHENYTDDRSLKLALKGADTLQKANNTPRPVKLAMSIDMLKVLGHRVSMLDWSTHSK